MIGAFGVRINTKLFCLKLSFLSLARQNEAIHKRSTGHVLEEGSRAGHELL